MASIFEESEEDELVGATGGLFLPYQNEPLVSSAENLVAGPGEAGMAVERDQAEDEDGIQPSQLRDRGQGTVSLIEW